MARTVSARTMKLLAVSLASETLLWLSIKRACAAETLFLAAPAWLFEAWTRPWISTNSDWKRLACACAVSAWACAAANCACVVWASFDNAITWACWASASVRNAAAFASALLSNAVASSMSCWLIASVLAWAAVNCPSTFWAEFACSFAVAALAKVVDKLLRACWAFTWAWAEELVNSCNWKFASLACRDDSLLRFWILPWFAKALFNCSTALPKASVDFITLSSISINKLLPTDNIPRSGARSAWLRWSSTPSPKPVNGFRSVYISALRDALPNNSIFPDVIRSRDSVWTSWAWFIASLESASWAFASWTLSRAALTWAWASSAWAWASVAAICAAFAWVWASAAAAWAWSAFASCAVASAVSAAVACSETASKALASSINWRLAASGFDFWTSNNCANTASAAASWFWASNARAWAFSALSAASPAAVARPVAWAAKFAAWAAVSWAARSVSSNCDWITALLSIALLNCANAAAAWASESANCAAETASAACAITWMFCAWAWTSTAWVWATSTLFCAPTTASCAEVDWVCACWRSATTSAKSTWVAT